MPARRRDQQMVAAMLSVIEETMKDQAVTQDRMGDAIGLTQGQVSKMLRGRRNVSTLELLAMCDALDVPLSVVAQRAAALVDLS